MDDTLFFAKLYKQYYTSSLLFVKSYVRDRVVSEDIVSEAMICLWQTIKKENIEHPQTLLLKILKNKALDYLRHEDVKQNAIESISSTMICDLKYRIGALESCNPEEIFSREITEIIAHTLSTLPKQTMLIFKMSRYEYLSVREIAEKLSLSPKSIEYHITKSLKALRIALKEYLPILCFFIV